MLWGICLNQGEKNSRHGSLGESSITAAISWNDLSNLLKSFQMIPRNWNSNVLVYISLSYMNRKRNIPEMAEIHNVNFFLPWMKFTFWQNWMKWPIKFSRCMLYCVWAFISNCPWHFNSWILLCFNILDERILHIFVTIIGRSGECQRECIYGNLIFYGNIYFVFYRNICLYHGNILKMLWKYICLNHWEGRGMPGNASLEICILYSIEYILYLLQIYLKFSHIPI